MGDRQQFFYNHQWYRRRARTSAQVSSSSATVSRSSTRGGDGLGSSSGSRALPTEGSRPAFFQILGVANRVTRLAWISARKQPALHGVGGRCLHGSVLLSVGASG